MRQFVISGKIYIAKTPIEAARMGILDIEKGSKKIIFFQVKEIGKNKEYKYIAQRLKYANNQIRYRVSKQ